MFKNHKDEYLNATEDARINTYKEESRSNTKWIIINFLIVLTLAYFLFAYLKSETTLISEFLPTKKAVLGVSRTVDDTGLSDEELMKILKVTSDELEPKSSSTDSQYELSNSMKLLTREPMIKAPSSYTKAISREVGDKHRSNGRIVVVKKGDTLSSLSEKYYGNSMAFSKIIEHNPSLKNQGSLLKVGQVIKLPY